MEQRIASVLFYGAMMLVAVTCTAELWHPWQGMTAEWAGALGSWVGGVGSFAAAGTAVWVATWQKRQDRIAAKAEHFRRQKVVAYKVFRFCINFLEATSVVQEVDITFFQSKTVIEDRSYVATVMLRGFRYEMIDQIQEMYFVDQIAVDLMKAYAQIGQYLIMVDELKNCDDSKFFATAIRTKQFAERLRRKIDLLAREAGSLMNE